MERRVQPAAIALMATAAFSFLVNLGFLGLRVFGISFVTLLGGMPSVGDVVAGTWGLAASGLALGVQAFIFYAGLKMMNLEQYPIAVAGAAAALIPCFLCCCTNIPIGIWALVVLLMPDTKTAFSS